MEKIIRVFFVTILLIGCANRQVIAEPLVVSGIIVDEMSRVPVGGVPVELQIFHRGFLIQMGSYKKETTVVTDGHGRFEFSVERGKSIQIVALSPYGMAYGGLKALHEITTNHSDILILYKDR
jgi:hypothetical protein